MNSRAILKFICLCFFFFLVRILKCQEKVSSHSPQSTSLVHEHCVGILLDKSTICCWIFSGKFILILDLFAADEEIWLFFAGALHHVEVSHRLLLTQDRFNFAEWHSFLRCFLSWFFGLIICRSRQKTKFEVSELIKSQRECVYTSVMTNEENEVLFFDEFTENVHEMSLKVSPTCMQKGARRRESAEKQSWAVKFCWMK